MAALIYTIVVAAVGKLLFDSWAGGIVVGWGMLIGGIIFLAMSASS